LDSSHYSWLHPLLVDIEEKLFLQLFNFFSQWIPNYCHCVYIKEKSAVV
jgi:hypothetical protein